MRGPCDDSILRTAAAKPQVEPKAKAWILAATILGSSLAFIDGTVVNVALPALQNSFHATVADVQWVVEAYGLVLAALILVGGSLGDMFGRRTVFILGVAIFALASAACGMAPSIHLLIVARSIQGAGAALLVPGSLAIISASFDEKSRGQAIGTWSGFTAITTAAGPVLGGWLVEHASWRWVFFINIPLAVVVIVISVRWIYDSRNPEAVRVDWPGAILATVGLGGLVSGFIESANAGWKDPIVLGSLAVGASCMIALLFFEKKTTTPMIPLSLFKSRSFSGANLLTLFLYSAIGIFFFLFPMNLIQVQGYSTTATGLAILPLILLIFVLSRWSGGLVARYGARSPLIVGPLLVASGFVLFAVPSVGAAYWRSFFPGIVILGLGMAVSIAPLTTVVMNSVGRDRVGAASGINNAVARVAGVLAIAVLGIVMFNAFSLRLNRELDRLSLPSTLLADLHANETKLGGMHVPDGPDRSTQAAIETSIKEAFVFGFRTIMLICAALAAAGAAVAGLMIPVGHDSPAAPS